MNTTTNTRGVSESMVAELITAGDFLAMNGTDGMVRRWERAKAALSAEPAVQREGWPAPPWLSIDQLPASDDLFWFLRGDTVDGPRAPQFGGYDADEWDYFAPCVEPPTELTVPPAQPADSKVIGDDSQIKPGERVPEGWALVPREALGYVSDLLAERKYGSAGRSPAHNARVVVDYWLTATPAAPAEEEPPTCPICDQMKLSARCSACGYEEPTTGAAR